MALNFDHLNPELCFQSAEAQGFHPTGALFPLNSYENRVYEIPLEDGSSIIAKYYRPGRWTAEAITDEHRFILAADEAEIPVVQPYQLEESINDIESLAEVEGIYYTFYPKFRGREHDEITDDDRQWLGRSLARLHNVGENFSAKHRIHLTAHTYGYESLDYILRQDFLPDDLRQSIQSVLQQLLQLVEPYFTEQTPTIALHGDCHPGNILWNPEGPHLLDFDDMIVAPAVQDIWMLFNGSADDQKRQRDSFFEGYGMFRDFDFNTMLLAEPLRALRMIRHSAWIGQRYDEALFQRAFPYYRERRYWEEFLLAMKEQISAVQEPSLIL